MNIPKPGEVQTSGGAVHIGAPIVEARMSTTLTSEPTPSQLVAIMLRHLKGVLSAAEELRVHLERAEKEKA